MERSIWEKTDTFALCFVVENFLQKMKPPMLLSTIIDLLMLLVDYGNTQNRNENKVNETNVKYFCLRNITTRDFFF